MQKAVNVNMPCVTCNKSQIGRASCKAQLDVDIPWGDIDSTINDVFALSQYSTPFNSETKRIKRILDAKYSKSDLKTIAGRSTHPDSQERNELYTLLKKYECLFDGNLGTWHGKHYDIKLKPDAEQYHSAYHAM